MREPGSADPPQWPSDRLVALGILLLGVLVYLVSIREHATHFDYFGRLAEAFTQGRYWLDDAPPHLNELVEGVGGHRYSVVPPLPAILLVPLVPFGSTEEIQTFLSALAGGASGAPLYLALRRLAVPRAFDLAAVACSTFGTTLWVSAVDGRSWYAADAIAVLVLSLALWAAVAGAPSMAVGAVLGVATLARLPLVLVAPGLLLLTRGRRPLAPRALAFAVGLAPFIGIEALYDLLRWGTPLEVGYGLLSADDPFYSGGLFSITYLPRHIYAILFEPPAYVDGQLLFLRAKFVGMSLLVATPAFLWLARVPLVVRSFRPATALLLACLPLVPDVLFGTVGFEQYAYRRSLDAQPFLIALLAVAGGWERGRWMDRPPGLFLFAVGLSVAVTLYFLVTIRLYGFAR